ncbi:MAG: nucleotide sugar dehydrogenase [Chloroflexi bacterium]|nr:nucleotide sugar dehydrogenase [Chloroflexota bacterium]
MVTKIKTATVCVVGAGYVGLPLSRRLSRSYQVISFDIDDKKIRRLSEQNGNPNHIFTTDSSLIAGADFILVCVPTPLTRNKQPDMSYIKQAAATVGQHMKKGVIVVVESSVYPGVTEELVGPILEQMSGYKCGQEFKLAYSPERLSPGDSEYSVDKVVKVVSACDDETLDEVVDLYRQVTPNVFRARNIRTAEAAKLVENTQRDLNIALINELSILFQKMDISTQDVLDAAATKWNFQRLSPGMVGGYCIPVVPYFLVSKAEEHGFHPQVILAGRAVNDHMPKHIAEMAVKAINSAGKAIKGSKVLIMGCTYKENVADTRESPAREMISELREYGVELYGHDPLVENGELDFGIRFIRDLASAPKVDCIILTVLHDAFRELSLERFLKMLNPGPAIIDVRGYFDTPEMRSSGIIYKTL